LQSLLYKGVTGKVFIVNELRLEMKSPGYRPGLFISYIYFTGVGETHETARFLLVICELVDRGA
jgi:hypothetical protein